MKDIITKKEFESIINSLDNAIDRFLLAGFYYGINGKQRDNEQLLNLKTTSLDFKNKKINLPDDRVVYMDALLEDICKKAVEQKIYVKYGSSGMSNEDYYLNTNSEYIIKVKPTTSTNDGLSPMGVGGVKKRLKMISKVVGINITPSLLKLSGVYELLKNQKTKLTIIKSETILKENGMSIRRNTLIPLIRDINKKLDV